jgi:integrase
MPERQNAKKTLEDIRQAVRKGTLRHHGKSATERICAMADVLPAMVAADASTIRALLRKVSPALHGMTSKSWANLLSRFRQELRLADVIDPNRQGCAARHPAWVNLVQAIAKTKNLANGLAAFLNWCASHNIIPEAVDDSIVQRFHAWLEHRTLCPKPRDLVRQTPSLWNVAGENVAAWPKSKLTVISFKAPFKRLQWDDLPASFRADVEAYAAMRLNPDLFDERPNAPPRPLAASTIQQQKAHLRLAGSVLVEGGVPLAQVTSLSILVEPERFKTVLLHYHERAGGQPNAFVVCLAQTLIQVAHHYLDCSHDHVAQLKRMAQKLPPIPHELTGKNKAFLRQLESDRLRAELVFLPERLVSEVTKGSGEGRVEFVKAQVAVAIEFQLAIPLRPQNLCRLNWSKHLLEHDGSRGRMLLHIPGVEMKSGNDFDAEVPEHVARRLLWYRRHILPKLDGDPNGDFFVTRQGKRKGQDTFTDQIIKTIRCYLGIHMSPHQFRHLAGHSYLEDNPEDFETAKSLLGHGWAKTTKIYVGCESRRASRAYNNFVFKQREALKLKRKRQRACKPKKEPVDA